MKIAIFCKTLFKGGAEKQAIVLSKLLTENKIDTILINWHESKIDSGYLDYIHKNSIQYIGFSGNPISKMIYFLKLIKKERITHILSYLTFANFIVGISKIFYRNIFTVGGIRTEKLPLYKFVFERIVHNYLNDATIFNNYSAKEKFEKKRFNSEKIFVIHNAINIPDIQKDDHTDDTIKIVSVSRFVESKDFQTAIHSFNQLKEKNSNKNIKYYIVGYGELENDIRKLVKHLNLTHSVEIMINPPNIPDILNSCDIYLSTSLYEGLSNSIMEAMVASLPIIATDVGDNRHLIKDAKNGFLVPCKDCKLIVEKLDYLVNSENTRKEFGSKSRFIIENEFSEVRLFENYYNFLSKLSTDLH
jgi:glycosyltransferase involved in cell wall biosynthesis